MHLQESGEMYLESIYRLSKQSNAVRSVDISEYMGYSKPSVSRAVNLLKNGGYIVMDQENFITLTDAGREIAEKIYDEIYDFANYAFNKAHAVCYAVVAYQTAWFKYHCRTSPL